jgi:hypothetical protein
MIKDKDTIQPTDLTHEKKTCLEISWFIFFTKLITELCIG